MPLLTLAFILDAVILTAFVLWLLKKVKPQKVPGQNIEQAQTKSYQLLHDAIKKAENIIEQTNLQQTNIVSEAITETAKHTQQSKQLFDAELKSFLDNLTVSHQEYLKFLENLKAGAQKAQFDNLNTIKQTTNQLFLQFESELSNFLTQTRQQSTDAVELELKAMRQMVETYKHQQLKLIDENIVAMLERTLSLVLPKKLNLNDQIELIYEALEKAKAEKFIV